MVRNIDELIQYKTALKSRIGAQKNVVEYSVRKVFTPTSLAATAFSTVGKNLNFVSGIMSGLKVFLKIRKIIKRFRH